ncbi:hypothetical protein ACFWM1_19380 [Nocardia sp. NPDC058379]|uniref:hypothetical protein n=1 Tax=unclassified Nocardia TaxID=2637762 RepID=UPI0036548D2A
MRFAYLFGGQVSMTPETIDEFCRTCPAVENAYDEAAECTGLSVDILRGRHPDTELLGTPEDRHSIGALRQAALNLGLADDLSARGVEVVATGGLSLGALISTCVAGAVQRHELFGMLRHRRLVPRPDDIAGQGMALLSVPIEDVPERYYGQARPGLYLAVDTGPIDGVNRSFVLSGYTAALRELHAEIEAAADARHMFVLDAYQGAFHSPLQQYAADFMREFVSGMTFRDPRIPVCSPVSQRSLTTAAEVRDFVWHNNLLPARYEPIIQEMDRLDVRGGLVVGPGLPPPAVQPFPVDVVAEPGDLDRLPASGPVAIVEAR